MKITSAEVGDSIFLACGTKKEVEKILSLARDKIGSDLNLIDENSFAFCWIVDYPMFEKDEELIPEDEDDSYRYILDVLKKHEHFGQISGWGNEAIYINIPEDIKTNNFLHDIRENPSIETHKDLIDYLNCLPYARIPIALKGACMRVKDSI